MQSPLELSFREVTRTEAIDSLIAEKIEKLEKVYDHIISCHLAVERPQAHLKHGNPYRVRLDIRVPHGSDIVITHEAGKGDMHYSLESVLREVFESALRQLKKLGELQRGDTKRHITRDNSGVIIELDKDAGYGFLRSHDGQSIYFHHNSVQNSDFDVLKVGATVRFDTELGEEGVHARSVYVLDPRGLVTANDDGK